jgi:hypothetical protein
MAREAERCGLDAWLGSTWDEEPVLDEMARLDLRSRVDRWPYALRMVFTTGERGDEMDTAASYLAHNTSPVVLLFEQAYLGVNVNTLIKVTEARARWVMAFEHKIAKSRPMEIVGVPATTWQAGWLGLGSMAGRPALKAASDLAAQHFFEQAGVPDSIGRSIEGDAADAVNINLWWLDHHLSGLPRKFASKTSKARMRARTKPWPSYEHTPAAGAARPRATAPCRCCR